MLFIRDPSGTSRLPYIQCIVLCNLYGEIRTYYVLFCVICAGKSVRTVYHIVLFVQKSPYVLNIISRTYRVFSQSTPTIFMLKDLTILNPGESINKRIILPDMAKIGIGPPRTIWKVDLMECT